MTLPLNLLAVPSKPDLRGRLLAKRSDPSGLLAMALTQIEASRSARTRADYQSDWGLFSAWCASIGTDALPATIETVSAYLVALGEAGYADATIERHTASISVAHKSAGYDGHDVPTSVHHDHRSVLSSCGLREDALGNADGLPLGRDALRA